MEIKGPSHDVGRSNAKTLTVQEYRHSTGCSGVGTSTKPHFDLDFFVGEKEFNDGRKERVRIRIDFETWEEIEKFTRMAFYMGQAARRYARRVSPAAAPDGWKLCTKCNGLGEQKPEVHTWREYETCSACDGSGEIANG